MFLLKILIWLSVYFIFYIIFSLNTLISFVCFIAVILIICLLLLQLQVEYLTYLILLLYLGGIIIFFLFTSLMLNYELSTIKPSIFWSPETLITTLIFFKSFFLLTCLNFKLCYVKSHILMDYFPTFIENFYFMNDLFKNQGDTITLLSLYTEKSILLLVLGLILLYTMMGVIIITRK